MWLKAVQTMRICTLLTGEPPKMASLLFWGNHKEWYLLSKEFQADLLCVYSRCYLYTARLLHNATHLAFKCAAEVFAPYLLRERKW